MTIKKLPPGDRTFADIIDDNLLYADKTRHIYELIKSQMRNFFPSRPHGFGKTLLLHTLSERFTGDRERFKDLWIGRSDYAFPKHPVIFLSLPTGAPDAEVLERNIMDALDSIAGDHNLKVGWATSDMRLEILVRALHEKPGPGSPCSSTSMTPR